VVCFKAAEDIGTWLMHRGISSAEVEAEVEGEAKVEDKAEV
jgi:hypothetical protein